ncbi:MAG: ATP-binding protein [Gammaproteobacteria bacterium]|nr:ATP-binding protein [Gammaproteobacteria bacterium]
MTLKRQLLLVSLLALMLPWAGCEFIRETESALRASQQQMLASTASAFADSMEQYAEEFPDIGSNDYLIGDQLYGHQLETAPLIDGYFDDWTIEKPALRDLPGPDGPIRFAIGLHQQFAYLYVSISDHNVIYANANSLIPGDGAQHADRVRLISANPPYLEEALSFAAEAPGSVVTYMQNAFGFAPEPTIRAYWQDVPGGYQLEARMPLNQLGTHLGLIVNNTATIDHPGVRSASFSARSPGAFVSTSQALTRIAENLLVQPGMRMIVTDFSGWRIATVGNLRSSSQPGSTATSNWLRFAYGAVVEPGKTAAFAEPDPGGREQQPYIASALDGRRDDEWFRSDNSGKAVVAVAEPVMSGNRPIGAIVLQQGTDAILSLTNQGLARLMNVTLIAMLVVAASLLGYATWLSRRIRRLSIAAEAALESDQLRSTLPSSNAADEIGDLSRSFSNVLIQLGDYNEYLRTLASKLSHELRTPLAIVTSSLENLEHEKLNEASAGYTARAKDGAERLRRILTAMSEASRVEELMKNAEPERFDLRVVVESTVNAYCDAYTVRRFEFVSTATESSVDGSPELINQMLDKLIENAVSFSADGDQIDIALTVEGDDLRLDVSNPGPPLPERMRSQLFDSLISMREKKDDKHLGLGLYIAKLIADGHNGHIDAENTDEGVKFSVWLPRL